MQTNLITMRKQLPNQPRARGAEGEENPSLRARAAHRRIWRWRGRLRRRNVTPVPTVPLHASTLNPRTNTRGCSSWTA